MDTVKTVTLIETTLTRRGRGTNIDSPIRIITQYWAQDGTAVIESDPTALLLTPEKQAAMREALYHKLGESDKSRDAWCAMMDAVVGRANG